MKVFIFIFHRFYKLCLKFKNCFMDGDVPSNDVTCRRLRTESESLICPQFTPLGKIAPVYEHTKCIVL